MSHDKFTTACAWTDLIDEQHKLNSEDMYLMWLRRDLAELLGEAATMRGEQHQPSVADLRERAAQLRAARANTCAEHFKVLRAIRDARADLDSLRAHADLNAL